MPGLLTRLRVLQMRGTWIGAGVLRLQPGFPPTLLGTSGFGSTFTGTRGVHVPGLLTRLRGSVSAGSDGDEDRGSLIWAATFSVG